MEKIHVAGRGIRGRKDGDGPLPDFEATTKGVHRGPGL